MVDAHAGLGRVREHLLQHLDTHLSLSAAARIAGLHPKYFCVCFKRRLGMGFSEWVRRVRIEEAQRLLTTTDASIADTAYTVGFNDVRTFQRAFKRVTGITPWAYKKRVHSRSTPGRRG